MEKVAVADSKDHIGVFEGVAHMMLGGVVLALASLPFAADGLPPMLFVIWAAWAGLYAVMRLRWPGFWMGRWNPASFLFVWVYGLLTALAGIGLAV